MTAIGVPVYMFTVTASSAGEPAGVGAAYVPMCGAPQIITADWVRAYVAHGRHGGTESREFQNARCVGNMHSRHQITNLLCVCVCV